MQNNNNKTKNTYYSRKTKNFASLGQSKTQNGGFVIFFCLKISFSDVLSTAHTIIVVHILKISITYQLFLLLVNALFILTPRQCWYGIAILTSRFSGGLEVKDLFNRSHNTSHSSLYPDVLKIKTIIVEIQNLEKMPFVQI